MTIAEMYERLHLFVEHTVGEQTLMGELNPLIEYPINYPLHNENVAVHVEEIIEEIENDGVAVEMDNERENVGVHVEEIDEEMENDGVAVEMDNEGVVVDMENEGVAVEMENEGGDGIEGFVNEEGVYVEDDELDYGGNFEKEVVTNEGPTVGVESVNVGPTVVDERVIVGPTVGVESSNVGPTMVEEIVNVGPTILEVGINNGPTDLNMGVNESGPSGVVNDFGPPIDEHEEYRDEYVDENWSKGDGY